MKISNNLELPPVQRSLASPPIPVQTQPQIPDQGIPSAVQTEFMFELPKGYLDTEGNVHRKGVMRLARAIDEIVPMRDPRVRSNPAYATIIILSRVMTRLGSLQEVTPVMIEGLFACDLNYLQQFYRHINELDPDL